MKGLFVFCFLLGIAFAASVYEDEPLPSETVRPDKPQEDIDNNLQEDCNRNPGVIDSRDLVVVELARKIDEFLEPELTDVEKALLEDMIENHCETDTNTENGNARDKRSGCSANCRRSSCYCNTGCCNCRCSWFGNAKCNC